MPNGATSYGRPRTAKIDEQRHQINNIEGHKHRNLFQTTYQIFTENTKAPRPVSAAPNRAAVSFSAVKTRDPLEPNAKKLFREYKADRARNSKINLTKNWERKQTELASQARELNRQNNFSSVPAPMKIIAETQILEEVEDAPQTPPRPQAHPRGSDDSITPEKVDNHKELKIRHDLNWGRLAQGKLKGRLDMEISNNYTEQSKLHGKIEKLHDQQREREFQNNAKRLADIAHYQRELQKREYGNYAKHDLTQTVHKKDRKLREYSKDNTNLNNTLNTRKGLLEERINMTAYNLHQDRRNRFMSQTFDKSFVP
mmetsp:Transcript_21271/g.23679  ORF Transcript_21271/g.23679 Transcript_21271/m.23679 type:complete len:313 (-) Transcript_21271:70-1008(-)